MALSYSTTAATNAGAPHHPRPASRSALTGRYRPRRALYAGAPLHLDGTRDRARTGIPVAYHALRLTARPTSLNQLTNEKVLSGEECLGQQCLRVARSAWASAARKGTSSASVGGMVASTWVPGRGGVPGCGEQCLGKERAR